MVETRLAAARSAILDAALPVAAAEGWSRSVLDRATEAAAVDAPLAARAFPRGPRDLVAALFARADGIMESELALRDIAALHVPVRIDLAVRLWFAAIAPHRVALGKAAAVHAADPAGAAQSLWRTADALWRGSGDTSADFAYYTKRASLAAILAATFVVWRDDSEETHWEAFLSRRLAEAGAFGRTRRRVGAAAQSAARGAAAILRGLPRFRPGAP